MGVIFGSVWKIPKCTARVWLSRWEAEDIPPSLSASSPCAPVCTLSSCSHYTHLCVCVCVHMCIHLLICLCVCVSCAHLYYSSFREVKYQERVFTYKLWMMFRLCVHVCVRYHLTGPLVCALSGYCRAHQAWSSSSTPHDVPVNVRMLALMTTPLCLKRWKFFSPCCWSATPRRSLEFTSAEGGHKVEIRQDKTERIQQFSFFFPSKQSENCCFSRGNVSNVN